MEITDDLSCPVCYETYDSQELVPRLITVCGHSICDKCLGKFRQNRIALDCPVCKRPFNCEGLPINYGLKNVAETRNSLLSSNQHASSGSGQDQSSIICSDHRLTKDYRCSTCEEWICAKCGMNGHRQCETRAASDAMQDVLNSLLSQVHAIVNYMKNSEDATGKAKIQTRINEEIRERESRIEALTCLITAERNRVEKLARQYDKNNDDRKFVLDIVDLLEKCSLDLTNTNNVSFSDFLKLESIIRTHIQLLNDIMSNNEVPNELDQACALDEEQMFKNQVSLGILLYFTF